MNKNYQKELEKIIAHLDKCKKVFMHSCCAPCSSYCMEYLRQYFDLTVFYYNPNIMQETEYRKRVEEQQRLVNCYNQKQGLNQISFLEGTYDLENYLSAVKGMEDAPER